ncbi:hypothetical protein VKT23_014910 [Stygiomarasmius scandens]|uniref:Uncharacterized protein n=1 Tax=Marasmiellus scandens TaxID=2682957 RepID=A0ABR1J432_9AGAR
MVECRAILNRLEGAFRPTLQSPQPPSCEASLSHSSIMYWGSGTREPMLLLIFCAVAMQGQAMQHSSQPWAIRSVLFRRKHRSDNIHERPVRTRIDNWDISTHSPLSGW